MFLKLNRNDIIFEINVRKTNCMVYYLEDHKINVQ